MDAIKSKERVQKHGEVFTPDSIVLDMIKLTKEHLDAQIKKEEHCRNIENTVAALNTEYEILRFINSTWLEPSCGNGNFLIRLLDIKLNAVEKLPEEFRNLGLVMAVSSIYGVDIQSDNVEESKARMLELIKNGSVEVLELPNKEKAGFNFTKYELTPELESLIKFILDNNIKHGNCLTGRVCKDHNTETQDSMVFAEYIWDGQTVTVKGHNLTDIENDEDNDLFNNNGRKVNYMDMKSLNFSYSELYSEDESYDF